MNNVNLIGRFGKDPETVTRKGSNGDFESLMSSIAVNSNDKKDESYWIDIHAMGKTAENIAKYFEGSDYAQVSFIISNNPNAFVLEIFILISVNSPLKNNLLNVLNLL